MTITFTGILAVCQCTRSLARRIETEQLQGRSDGPVAGIRHCRKGLAGERVFRHRLVWCKRR